MHVFSKRTFLLRLISAVFFLTVSGATPLIAMVYEPIPPIQHPADNPWSEEKRALGEKLFFDPMLSGDNSLSCGSCHKPELGWTDGLERGKGFKRKELLLNTPTILNTGHMTTLFWDGRSPSLEDQAKAPIQSPVEMNQKADELINELKASKEYVELFRKAFGTEDIDLDNIAKAIATFERTLNSGTSAYDRFWEGDKTALSTKAQKGMRLFFGKAKCSICHNGPFFTDNQFHNIGTVSFEKKDLGRKKITGEEFHMGAYKTPGLRDLSRTGPYFHNGSVSSLEGVIDFYNQGGNDHSNKSPFITPIGLNSREKESLIEFLESLTSDSSRGYKSTIE